MGGVSGPLVSHQYAEQLLGVAFAGRLGERSRDQARRRIRAWWRRDACALGPSSPLRSMFDLGAAPLVGVLGFSARQPRETCHGALLAGTAASDALTLPLLVGAWGAPLDGIWGAVARESARLASAWVLCFNGRALRLCDGRNTFARGYLEFDLEALADHPAAMALFWGAMRAEALGTITPAIAGESARHGVAVSASLRNGVREALLLLLRGMLASGSRNSAASFDKARLAWTLDQAFTIVYRVLFLLFAESRSLVPTWHPLYRRSYTIEALRRQAETPGSERGIWEALQAVSRLAHAGCHAGSLVVAPFNGRLFAPARAPLAETGQLDDRLVADALVALTTLASGGRRERVAFGDLGVEQLGAVYESVLDYAAGTVDAAPIGRESRSDRGPSQRDARQQGRDSEIERHLLHAARDHRVSRAAHAAAARRGATADGILRLKVLDPAMGSGALLVAACRYLAAAYEAALVRERGCFASEIGESDRAGFRRLVAQHCLYGVDLNPMAVQLARLSMWLTTLARGRPLSFLDHRFVTGDSLVGATLEDVARQPPGGSRSRRAPGPLPLFEAEDAAAAMRAVVPVRVRLAATPDDSAETVHDKERLLASTRAPASAMTALRGVADLWCACWFWAGTSVPQPGPAEFGDLAAALRSGGASLPERIARPRLDEARRIAERRRFLHWTLEFPEVYLRSRWRAARRARLRRDSRQPAVGDGAGRHGRRRGARRAPGFGGPAHAFRPAVGRLQGLRRGPCESVPVVCRAQRLAAQARRQARPCPALGTGDRSWQRRAETPALRAMRDRRHRGLRKQRRHLPDPPRRPVPAALDLPRRRHAGSPVPSWRAEPRRARRGGRWFGAGLGRRARGHADTGPAAAAVRTVASRFRTSGGARSFSSSSGSWPRTRRWQTSAAGGHGSGAS